MPIHYAIAHVCDVKTALGGESGLASAQRLRQALRVARHQHGDAADSLRWLKQTTGVPMRVPLAEVHPQLAELEKLEPLCAGCRANRLGEEGTDGLTPFACSATIRLPITAGGEQYIRSLLTEGLQVATQGRYDLRLLLIEQLHTSTTRGLASAALRGSSRGAEFYELRHSPVASNGRWFRRTRMNTDQVFERSILERRLSDGMCLFLAGFSGGIRVQPVPPDTDVRDMKPADGVPWTLVQPDDPARPDVLWTFELPDPPAGLAGDRSVQDFRRFFTACFHTYTLRYEMALEAAVAPGVAE